MKYLKISLLLTFATLFISGCAAGGSRFTVAETAKEDKGLVVFYRQKNHQGSAINIQLQDNDINISSIQNGQFIFYDVEPGKHEFRTNTAAIDRAVDLDIEAGKTYYLSASIRVGLWVSSWSLTRVYDEQALAELKACCKDGKK